MNDPGSVFGPGGSNGGSGNPIKKQQQFDSFPAKVQQKPVQNQNNIGYPAPAPQPSKFYFEFSRAFRSTGRFVVQYES